ncbi:hypothetical protein [uncultured Microbulbifer sp.]|uniref:energy transducer TonB n=1 Tax=uncultured Microbulbifer sp. TaxID=348147 RepID=UPI002611A1DA|nr:hypothetical protein [uncultured Microbulbifer sp.]
MVKLLAGVATLLLATLLLASNALAEDWQRPDCSTFEEFSACRNAERNDYRRQKQQEFRANGLSFWYYERPDFSENKVVEKALKDKVEGALFFSFSVERDGSVSAVELSKKSSEEVAVYAGPILAAMKNWQFVPSEKSWANQEWRYQFFFEPEQCNEDTQEESCESGSDSGHGKQKSLLVEK